MIVRYDSFERLEKPQFILCNPGSYYSYGSIRGAIGSIPGTEAEELAIHFNSMSELNFRMVCAETGDEEADAYIADIFQKLKNRRLIYLSQDETEENKSAPEGYPRSDVGYFMITDVTTGYDGGLKYKDVHAQSIEKEFELKKIPYITSVTDAALTDSEDEDDKENGTYRFLSDNEGNTGVFNRIIGVMPNWEIGQVDDAVAERWRTFEDIDLDLNCLAFLTDNIQDAYDCVILFDCVRREVSAYDRATYFNDKQTDVYITRDDVIKSLAVEESSDDIYTAISVLGQDDETISAINPLGGNVIYDFTYYLDWMDTSLRNKVVAWQAEVDAAMSDTGSESFYKRSEALFTLGNTLYNREEDLKLLVYQRDIYKRVLDNMNSDVARVSVIDKGNAAIRDAYNLFASVANAFANAKIKLLDEDGNEVSDEDKEQMDVLQDEYIVETKRALEEMIAEWDGYIAYAEADVAEMQSRYDTQRSDLDAIQSSLSITEYFNPAQVAALQNYIFEASYTDEYIVFTDIMSQSEKFEQMKLMYDRAKERLHRVSRPAEQFSIDAESFLFSKEFEHMSSQLQTGCLITAEIDDNDARELFLLGITVNYDDKTLSLEFGSDYYKSDTKALFDDVLGSVQKSANTLNYIKEFLQPVKRGAFDSIRQAIAHSRDITMGAALSASDEEIEIDGSGYTGRTKKADGTYYPEQIKITGSNIVFTDDAWESCKLAIGKILFGDSTSVYGVNAEALISDIILSQTLKIINEQSSITMDKNGFWYNGSEENSMVDTRITTDGIVIEESPSDTVPVIDIYKGVATKINGTDTRYTLGANQITADDLFPILFSNTGADFYATAAKYPLVTSDAFFTLDGIDLHGYLVWYYNVDESFLDWDPATITDDSFLNVRPANESSIYVLLTLHFDNGEVLLYTNASGLNGQYITIGSDDEITLTSGKITPASVFSKIYQTFISIAQRIANVKETMKASFNELGLKIFNRSTRRKSAVTSDYVAFASDVDDEDYAYYGRDGVDTADINSDSIDTNFVTARWIDADPNLSLHGKAADSIQEAIDQGIFSPCGITQNGMNVDIMGGSHKQIAIGDDLNTYVKPGVYGIDADTVTGGVSNLPVANAGILRVRDSSGLLATTDGSTPANIQYITQEYTQYDGTAIYLRYATSTDYTSTTPTWTFGAWHMVYSAMTSSTLSAISDYVVESGTSNGFDYQLWNSGKAECWGRIKTGISATSNTATYAGGRYVQQNIDISYPTRSGGGNVFSGNPTVNITPMFDGAQYVNAMVRYSRPAGLRFNVDAPVALSSTEFYVNVHAIGKWK